jgi:hypothetical protein
MVVGTSIVLLLRSPLEDPLSAKRSIPIRRRVQAFVILAIAFFVAVGFAANHYVTAAHQSPDNPPVQDNMVVPSPEGSAVRPLPSRTPGGSRTHGPGQRPMAAAKLVRTAARAHSKDMRVKGYFEHNSPDGKTPWDRIKAAGYSQPGAENIAMGYATAKAVIDGWMNSPGHRANILNCKLKAVGIGVEYGSGGPWWTQDFGFQ